MLGKASDNLHPPMTPVYSDMLCDLSLNEASTQRHSIAIKTFILSFFPYKLVLGYVIIVYLVSLV